MYVTRPVVSDLTFVLLSAAALLLPKIGRILSTLKFNFQVLIHCPFSLPF